MSTPSGVVFDFDGVIVDSERHWPDVENAYLLAHTAGWQAKYYEQHLTGRHLPEIHDFLARNFSFDVTYEDYLKDYDAMARTLYSRKAQPLPGLLETLEYLNEKSIKTVIASSSKKDWIDSALRKHNLSAFFPIIISAFDNRVAHGKPAPDVYLVASEELGENPENLISVEDSKSGIESAKSAGLYCIGMLNGHNKIQDVSLADEIVNGYSNGLLPRLRGIFT